MMYSIMLGRTALARPSLGAEACRRKPAKRIDIGRHVQRLDVGKLADAAAQSEMARVEWERMVAAVQKIAAGAAGT